MFRAISGCRSVYIGMAVLAFLIALPLDHALAALVDTPSLKTDLCDNGIRERLLVILAREEVRVALLKHGIDPTEVEVQIAALTDDEVAQMRDRIGELPGGGQAAAYIPIWLAILILVGYLLVLTGVISLGAYAGSKIQEHQEEEYAKSIPYPAPPRVGPLPSVNPDEPWTGNWKVIEGPYKGVFRLKQDGDRVVSTKDSDHVLDAKVFGAMIWGKLGIKQDFKATIADDFLSFKGNVDSRYSVEGQRIEYAELKPEPTALKVNPSEPWTGKWKVSQGRLPGIWSLAQNGDTVISTSDSDFKLEAKVYGAMIRGKWSTKGGNDRDFQATIAEDGLSFNGAADYAALRDYFTAKKIE
jgi:predicted nuclease of predicted toxin-antitoxin system